MKLAELDLAQATIPALIEAAAVRFGDDVAVEEDGRAMSFRELADACRGAARAFIAAGVEPGDRVAVWAPNIVEWILAAVGLQAAGAALVPLNTRMKGAEAGYILEKSRARMLCAVDEFVGADFLAMLRGACGDAAGGRPVSGLPELEQVVLLRGAPPQGDGAVGVTGVTTWNDLLAAGEAVSEAEGRARTATVGADDISDILFTSGTTGKPKGVMTAHGQNLKAFESWSDVIGLRAGDRYLIVNPFFHAFGYKAGWLSAFMRGATVIPHLVFDVPEVLARVGSERISMLPGPPALYQSILVHPDRDSYDLSCLRLAVTGAAVIPVELIQKMRDVLGFETVITGYGLTEACGIATMCRYDDDPETIATTSGRAIPDVEVDIVTTDGSRAAAGDPGEVLIRGYNVMQGYFDDEAATREAIDGDGWLHTGDIGVMDERGYIRITDRIKDMFIMGGFNCYPAEIESLMLSNADVAQAAVVGVPDERMGEVGLAFVVPAPGKSPTPESVIAWCRDNMANYKVPRRVELVAELPTNAMGKVTKYVLREAAARAGA